MAKKTTYEDIVARAREIHGDKYEYPPFEYKNNKGAFTIICPVHGEFTKNSVRHITLKQGCNACKAEANPRVKPVLKSTDVWIAEMQEIHKGKYTYEKSVYKGTSKKITITCKKHGDFSQDAGSHARGYGCVKCSADTRSIKNRKDDSTAIRDFQKVHGDKYDYSQTVYTNAHSPIDVRCPDHGVFTVTANDHRRGSGCKQCRSKNGVHAIVERARTTSNGRKELLDYIRSIYKGTIIVDDKALIEPSSLYITIPEHKLAFEFNEIHDNAETNHMAKNHCVEQLHRCMGVDYKLITMFEDEWIDKNDIVKAKIRYLLNLDDRGAVYARKCTVQKATKKEKIQFLKTYHIQGDGASSIDLGLFDGDEMVALMCFKQDMEDTYTLNRYATSKTVVGGFSKLLKHFTQNNQWDEIVSFADLRWSDGAVYEKNDWIKDATLKPDYYYLYKGERKHKFNFRRKQLEKILGSKFDPSKTEAENTFENGIFQIWDCGKYRYKLLRKPPSNKVDLDIPERLKSENNIEILGQYMGDHAHHTMKCMKCSHVWNATPASKAQTLNIHGVSGCPACNTHKQKIESVKKIIAAIADRGLTFIKVIDYGKNKDGKHLKARVRNEACGHEFESRVGNLKFRDVKCPTCNTKTKVDKYKAYNKARAEKFSETATEWQKYQRKARSLTITTYRNAKHIVNPTNLPRGKSGEEGMYQVDHIKSIRYCFDNDIPIDECVDASNLQMLTWEENLSKGPKVDT